MRTMPRDMGGRLRYFRQGAGLSPEHVALELDLSAKAISDWERNYRTPRLLYLRQLAALYHVSVGTLVDVDTIAEEIAGVA